MEKMSPRVVKVLLLMSLMESVDRNKLQVAIKKNLDVDISMQELNKVNQFFDLQNMVNAERTK